MSLLVKILATFLLVNVLFQEGICENEDVEAKPPSAKQSEPLDPKTVKAKQDYVVYDWPMSYDGPTYEDWSQRSSEDWSPSYYSEEWRPRPSGGWRPYRPYNNRRQWGWNRQ